MLTSYGMDGTNGKDYPNNYAYNTISITFEFNYIEKYLFSFQALLYL